VQAALACLLLIQNTRGFAERAAPVTGRLTDTLAAIKSFSLDAKTVDLVCPRLHHYWELVEAEQESSVRIENLPEIVMGSRAAG
jgi:hypothetical protein